MFAVFGAFAAAVSESANAQTVSAAVGRVYTPTSGNIVLRGIPDSTFAVYTDVTLDLSGTLNDVFMRQNAVLQAAPFNHAADGYAFMWVIPDRSGGQTKLLFDDTVNSDGLPCEDPTNCMRNGDSVGLLERPVGNRNLVATLRVYTNADNNLALAFGEDSQTIAVAGVGEIYINSSTYMESALEAGVVGFRAVQCAETHLAAADEIMCDFRTAANTECTGGQVFTLADESDETQGGTCQDPPEEMTTPPGMTVAMTMSAAVTMSTASPETPESETETATASFAAEDEYEDFRIVAGVGSGIVFMLAIGQHFWGDATADNYAFSPSFGYSVNESGYSANAGGRVDFVNDEWRLFWTAGQANANGEFGDFRYSSGGEYKTDFWTASFSESVQGERADYDLSLSADLQDGIWSLSPVYRIHSCLEEGKTETQNSLNLEGVLEWNRWTIRQSAGFGWRRADEFGDSAKFRLDVVREF